MKKTINRADATYEFLEAIIAADQALIYALKEQREELRKTVEKLLNCADTNRDIQEIREAHKVLKDTRF